jgi:hypothetical protein
MGQPLVALFSEVAFECRELSLMSLGLAMTQCHSTPRSQRFSSTSLASIQSQLRSPQQSAK